MRLTWAPHLIAKNGIVPDCLSEAISEDVPYGTPEDSGRLPALRGLGLVLQIRGSSMSTACVVLVRHGLLHRAKRQGTFASAIRSGRGR